MFHLLGLLMLLKEPLHLKPGDPVLAIKVYDQKGLEHNLEDLVDGRTFCVFLLPDCRPCQNAVQSFAHTEPGIFVLFVYVDKIPENAPDNAMRINKGVLKQINAKEFPIIIGYHNGRLAFGFYGPVDAEKIGLFTKAIKGQLKARQ